MIGKAIADALASDKPKTRYLVGHGRKAAAAAAALPDRPETRHLPASSGSPRGLSPDNLVRGRGQRLSSHPKPKALVVYFSLTHQTTRVVEAMTEAFKARGCEVAKAPLEFTDERWIHHLSQFPMKHPIRQLSTILAAQLRHRTGEIRIPVEARAGDYDLVILASPTWWFQTSMPLRSYLDSPEAKVVLSGKPFACASISRRYFSINLRQQKKLGENGGQWVDKTHFVAAGGQVKSMLAWLGYMKHGEPQERVLGLKMYPPNLKPAFEEEARNFVGSVLDRVAGARATG